MTNAEYIHSLSNADLAKFLFDAKWEEYCKYKVYDSGYKSYVEYLEEWLWREQDCY